MNHLYHINDGDSFYPNDYPLVKGELMSIAQGLVGWNSLLKGEMVISFYKDHCLKSEWLKSYPEITQMITSRHFTTVNVESLFESCKGNKKFQRNLEDHIRGMFAHRQYERLPKEEDYKLYIITY